MNVLPYFRRMWCCLMAWLLSGGTAFALAETSGEADGVVQLNPYRVKAVFPAVTIRFKLSGQSLFEPLDDPVLKVEVAGINTKEGDTRSELEVGDRLIAVNGTELSGLTMHQIAAVVEASRKQGLPIWQVRRGLQTLHIYFGGDWEPPLPGLKR